MLSQVIKSWMRSARRSRLFFKALAIKVLNLSLYRHQVRSIKTQTMATHSQRATMLYNLHARYLQLSVCFVILIQLHTINLTKLIGRISVIISLISLMLQSLLNWLTFRAMRLFPIIWVGKIKGKRVTAMKKC